MSEAILRERLQAIIDWADLALKSAGEFDSHGVRNLSGPVFDAARTVLAMPVSRPRPALNHDLLERVLPILIHEAISAIESCSNLFWDGSDHIPIMGACSPEGVAHALPLIDLIREIESEIGPTDTPDPEWFESLIDGQWTLSSENCSSAMLHEANAIPAPPALSSPMGEVE